MILESQLCGYARKLCVGSKVFEDIYIELDVKHGKLRAYIPIIDEIKVFRYGRYFAEVLKQRKSNVVLEQVKLFSPIGYLESEEIHVSFIQSLRGPTLSHSSFLRDKLFFLGLPSSDRDSQLKKQRCCIIADLRLNEPMVFKLNLKREIVDGFIDDMGLVTKRIRELLFSGFWVKVDGRFFDSKIFITSTDGFASVILMDDSINLREIELPLRLAFSFAQGRFVERIAYLDGDTLTLNQIDLDSLSDNIPFQVLPFSKFSFLGRREYSFFSEFIDRFMGYWFSLDSDGKEKFSNALSFLIYSKELGKDTRVEGVFSHVFLSLEILCDGKIEKNKLRNELKIPSYDARFITEFRNNIVHGKDAITSISLAYEMADKESERNNSVFLSIKDVVEKRKRGRSLFVLCAFLEILDRYFLSFIGYRGERISPLNVFVEPYMNEIKLEDKELFDELSKR